MEVANPAPRSDDGSFDGECAAELKPADFVRASIDFWGCGAAETGDKRGQRRRAV
jgi:hypothetical protein